MQMLMPWFSWLFSVLSFIHLLLPLNLPEPGTYAISCRVGGQGFVREPSTVLILTLILTAESI